MRLHCILHNIQEDEELILSDIIIFDYTYIYIYIYIYIDTTA